MSDAEAEFLVDAVAAAITEVVARRA